MTSACVKLTQSYPAQMSTGIQSEFSDVTEKF